MGELLFGLVAFRGGLVRAVGITMICKLSVCGSCFMVGVILNRNKPKTLTTAFEHPRKKLRVALMCQ